jgi:hypothetical protein
VKGRVFGGLGLLAGMGAFFLNALPVTPRVKTGPWVNSAGVPIKRGNYRQRKKGSVNRGLKRIQGRQAAR